MEAAREHALVASARRDAAAFGELYDAYLPQIYGFIARRVEDRTVAEDLTAATFQRALGAVRSSDLGNASFGGFLYRVAASAVVDHARRTRRAIPPGVRASDLDEEGDREAARIDRRSRPRHGPSHRRSTAGTCAGRSSACPRTTAG